LQGVCLTSGIYRFLVFSFAGVLLVSSSVWFPTHALVGLLLPLNSHLCRMIQDSGHRNDRWYHSQFLLSHVQGGYRWFRDTSLSAPDSRDVHTQSWISGQYHPFQLRRPVFCFAD
jgi:hypothetical protein